MMRKKDSDGDPITIKLKQSQQIFIEKMMTERGYQ